MAPQTDSCTGRFAPAAKRGRGRARLWALLACTLVLWGCTKKPSTDPDDGGGGGGGGEPVDRSSRIAWDQEAADVSALNRLRFVVYIDGTRTQLAGVSCSTTRGSEGYPCVAPLPAMSSGRHTLELAAYAVDEGDIESGKATPLTITLASTSGSLPTTGAPNAPGTDGSLPVRRPAPRDVSTGDGARLRVASIAKVENPSALAVAGDGTVFVGYGGDRVQIIRGRQVLGDESLSTFDGGAGEEVRMILDLAPDPQFERSRLLYALEASGGATPFIRLSRFREAGGRLGERAVLMDRVPASRRRPAASLAFGGDGLLYVGFDDGDDPDDAGRAESYNGKVLQLQSDGASVRDKANHSPVFASNLRSPRGLSWDPPGSSLWVADAGRGELRRLQELPGKPPVERAYALPAGENPGSVAVYRSPLIPGLRGSLLVALTGDQDYLLGARYRENDSAIRWTERMRIPGDAPVRLVETAADGSIYVGTDREVLRLTPR